MKRFWIKWRHQWSHSNEDWQYDEIADLEGSDEESMKFFAMERASEYDYSDKYYGVEYYKIDLPPKEVLEKEIERVNRQITVVYEQMLRYRDLLETNYGNKEEG